MIKIDFSTIWKDPVWSKVIASVLFFILSQIFILLWSIIKKLKFVDVYKNIFKFLRFKRGGAAKKNISSSKSVINSPESNDLNPRIILQPTVFFHYRFCDAFPGLEPGYLWLTSRRDIHYRLKILLSYPTIFRSCEGHGTTTDPIWWFRGHSALFIENYSILNRKKCLINVDELIIDRLAAYKGRSYNQDFVYVECSPDKPTGLYKNDTEVIKDFYERFGEYKEEFGIYKCRKISRQEFDDGSALIRGKPHKIEEADLRVRNLTKYNFIISSKFSPYNCEQFSRDSKSYFIGLLKNTLSFDAFIEWMEAFPKNWLDD